MTPLQAPATHYRIAQGPRAGQKVLSLQLAPRHLARGGESRALCANAHGFSLHASVRVAADDRQGLEQLCRTITCPTIANERLSVNRAGHVVLKLKTAWRNSTSHHVMAIEHCPHCGGQLKLIAAIEEPAVIQRILTQMGLAAQPPPRAPALQVDLFEAA